jgi:hypothetical protein
VTADALLGCSPDRPESPPSATQGDVVAESQQVPTSRSDLPLGTARGWSEAEGLSAELEPASALRVMSCADQTAMVVILSDRPVDFPSVIEPLAPPDEIGRSIALSFGQDAAGAFAVIREHAGGHFIEAPRSAR